jgi:hypothetical protein
VALAIQISRTTNSSNGSILLLHTSSKCAPLRASDNRSGIHDSYECRKHDFLIGLSTMQQV